MHQPDSVNDADSPKHDRAAGGLHSGASAVLGELKASLAEVFAALGREIRQPKDLKAALEVHQTLAWKVFRFATSPSPLASARHLPGHTGMSALLAAASARGVPAASLDKVRASFDRYRRLVDTHTGDRATLEVMLEGMDENGKASSGKSIRRDGFRCNSSLWGTQMRLKYMCHIIGPSAREDLLDFVLIRGYVGMRRLRQGAKLSIMPLTMVGSDGTPQRRGPQTALEPASVDRGVAMLPRFCSDPLPDICIGKSPAGLPECQLGETPLGGRDGTTLVTGEIFRGAGSRYRSAVSPHGNTALAIRQPTECAVLDVWMHTGTLPGVTPKGFMYSLASGVAPDDQVEEHADLLPFPERAERVGQGISSAVLVNVPKYRELMSFAFSRAGWDQRDFVLFRLRQDYPAMPTSLVMRFELPAGPTP